MDELNENNNSTQNNKWTEGNEKTLRFIIVCAFAFLGGYLAMRSLGWLGGYTNRDLNRYVYENAPAPHHHVPPPNFDEDFIPHHPPIFTNTHRKDPFYNEAIPPIREPHFAKIEKPTKEDPIKILQQENGYEIIVDLAKFNNDEENIQFDIKPSSIKVYGHYKVQDENNSRSYSHTSYNAFNKKIDPSKMTKETLDKKLVIKLPYRK